MAEQEQDGTTNWNPRQTGPSTRNYHPDPMRRARDGKKNSSRVRWRVTWHQHADPRLHLQLQRPRPAMATEHVTWKQQQVLLAVLSQRADITNNRWQLLRDVSPMDHGRQQQQHLDHLRQRSIIDWFSVIDYLCCSMHVVIYVCDNEYAILNMQQTHQ